jgi:hypothetical protein
MQTAHTQTPRANNQSSSRFTFEAGDATLSDSDDVPSLDPHPVRSKLQFTNNDDDDDDDDGSNSLATQSETQRPVIVVELQEQSSAPPPPGQFSLEAVSE